MNIKSVSEEFSVSEQLSVADVEALAAQGVKSLICNRPDGESGDQPAFADIEAAAKKLGLEVCSIPVVSGQISDQDVAKFGQAFASMPKPLLAYCRTGTRSINLWALDQGGKGMPASAIMAAGQSAGYDLSDAVKRLGATKPAAGKSRHFEVVIIGAGAGGISTASSLLKRRPGMKIALVDKAQKHYYQPGWTLVGGGVFQPQDTERDMASLIPRGVEWIQSAAQSFAPENNSVTLDDDSTVTYDRMVVACGIKLNWDGIEGLSETLGRNGVTSNYRYDLAPYTWKLVSGLRSGKAVFTQPPMPIKCAGAPQKALYLSGDHWYRTGVLKDIDIQFYNAGGVLFGVKEYVPALMKYIEKYNATLNFSHKLIRVDGEKKTAWFEKADAEGKTEVVSTDFDMIHVCPPQQAPDVIRSSPLADAAGWVDVDQETLRHKKYANVWSLGDVMNAPNAKTAAAARKQAPIVAHNILSDMGASRGIAHYDGYGSCPLTVERGKIVLAEFGFGGKLIPSFPSWMLDGTQPTRLAWILKKDMLPPIYWHGMLKGHEWLVTPQPK
ncbi:MAG: TIGR01244 family phosphatase [Pseudomonadales bacterium]|nr:TIGR01244 family phosphatase [Pseudomonadales bacterium]